jgi:hypothetical protein
MAGLQECKLVLLLDLQRSCDNVHRTYDLVGE